MNNQKRVEEYIDSLKKLNSFMADSILRLHREVAQLENKLEESRRQFSKPVTTASSF